MPLRVLLVEDDDLMRSLFGAYLGQSHNYALAGTAADAADAIAQARSVQPDVILLDMVMPRMNGLEALPPLRAAAPRARVVMMSMLDARRVEMAALKLGATGFIDKALDGPDFLQRLDNLLGLPHRPRARPPISSPTGPLGS